MILRLTRPTPAQLARVVDGQRELGLTYQDVGATSTGARPAGFHHLRVERVLGHGDEVFTRAVAALRDWGPQCGSGLVVAADGPVAVGAVVGLAAPVPVGYVLAVCRVVYVEEDADRFAFGYGTLPLHPECGEEAFQVSRVDGVVTFRIVAFSRPGHPLARLAGPVARVLQNRATTGYLEAMRRAASG